MAPRPRRHAILLLSLALAGCASVRTGSRPVSSPPTPATAGTHAPSSAAAPPPLPVAVLWQRTAAEYRAIHLQVFREAGEAVERLSAGRPAGSWAVSLDADDTVIDNSLYALERARAGDRYSLPTWTEWVRRRAATPVPGAIGFLERVRALGGLVAVVTNRGESQCEDTRENLRSQSIPFDVLLCRPEGVNGEKEPRWEALEAGTAISGLPPVEILVWVGDNIGDFPDLDQSARDADEAAFAPFGERYFILPNPVYGSWENNPER